MNPYPKQNWRGVTAGSEGVNIAKSSNKNQTLMELYDFPEMMEDYLFELEIRNYSPNTIKTYRSIINSFYKFLLDQNINNDSDILKSFKRYIRYLKRERMVSQNYIYLVTVVVKKFFEFGGIEILHNVKTPKRTKSLPKSLNEDEVRRLIIARDNEVNNKNDQKIYHLRNKVILVLLYSTGLRVSELVNLEVDNIDLHDRTIRIRGKGEKDRIVLFDDYSKDLIEDYLEKRQNNNNYLFINRMGNHLSPRYVQMMIKDYAEAGGIKKKVTPHILRHSFATHLLKNGVDIRAIQQLLGHSNLSTTQIYTSVDMKTLKDVYDKAKLL
jgi:integrase/recombinase XerD